MFTDYGKGEITKKTTNAVFPVSGHLHCWQRVPKVTDSKDFADFALLLE
jgi:hypothetical protein